MISLKTLLNPAPAGRGAAQSFCSSPTSSSPPFSPTADMSLPAMEYPAIPPMRTSRETSNNSAKTKLRGPIRYPPRENIGEQAMFEIRRFRIATFGRIQQSCTHIPYNSGKKDFYEKTGRESFEVFQYDFTAPGQSVEYTVMWDYNVGLVRMTPFFKCCSYGKTVPAKMLNLNPGLKQITHSITGGSITAQGYWMPHKCARAVCATFCYHIAGALIPLFGPEFPSECIPPESPDYGRMVINPQLVIEATVEADSSRRRHLTSLPPNVSFPRSDPRAGPTSYAPIHVHEERKHALRPRLTCDPSWVADERDVHYYSVPNSASSTGSGHLGYMVTSRPNSSWGLSHHSPQYDLHAEPNPYLTAVPKITPTSHMSTSAPCWTQKRRLDYDDADYGYRGSMSPVMNTLAPTSATMTKSPESIPARSIPQEEDRQEPAMGAAAALLLLGMRNETSPAQTMGSPSDTSSAPIRLPEPWGYSIHRSKRQRARSP